MKVEIKVRRSRRGKRLIRIADEGRGWLSLDDVDLERLFTEVAELKDKPASFELAEARGKVDLHDFDLSDIVIEAVSEAYRLDENREVIERPKVVGRKRFLRAQTWRPSLQHD